MHINREPKRRFSFAKGPDNGDTKKDVAAVLSGNKKTFSEAHYRPAQQDSKKRCSECKFYVKPGEAKSDCTKVIGVLDADGTCDLFEEGRYDAPRESHPLSIRIEVKKD